MTSLNRITRTAACEPSTILSRRLSRRMERLRAQRSLEIKYRQIESTRWRRILWLLSGTANNPGDNISGVNNFKKGYTDTYNYLNFSDRIDYNVSDKLHVSGHFGRYSTDDINSNPTPNSSELFQPAGSVRYGDQVSADAVYTINPSTVANAHFSWNNLGDSYLSRELKGNWSQFWPNNPFYQNYQDASKGVPIYFPSLNIGGNTFGGPNFFWNQIPTAESFSIGVAHQMGSHYIKAGFEYRRSGGPTLVTGLSQFVFNSNLTADTFNNPNLNKSGDQFATFLLGALDNNSEMIGGPSPSPIDDFFGFYVGDDWKVSRNITLTLGLRDEYEAAWHDADHNLSQGLNLNAMDPAVAANPPVMPAAVTNIVGSNYSSFNGLWSLRVLEPGHVARAESGVRASSRYCLSAQ